MQSRQKRCFKFDVFKSGLLRFRCLVFCAALALAAGSGSGAKARQSNTSGIPIRFTLDRPGYVTLVVEDEAGNRVCNLLGETYLPAGRQTVTWDGYDIGTPTEAGALVRRRVAAGRYRVRGLVHDKITMRYEFAVNSPGTPPWFTRDGTGGWLATRPRRISSFCRHATFPPTVGGRRSFWSAPAPASRATSSCG